MTTTNDTVTLTIDVDTTAFARAMAAVQATFEATAARFAALAVEVARADRRRRRHSTHVWERPAASRMHAAYRVKTRRRNRRRTR